MAISRKGLGQGKGSGYRNILNSDSHIHAQASKGIKQPQSMPLWSKYSMATKKQVTKDLKLKDSDKDGVANVFDCKPFDKKHTDDLPVKEINDIQDEINYKIENPKKAKVKETIKKTEKNIGSFFTKEKNKLQEYLKNRKLDKIKAELKIVKPEEEKKREAQEKRVKTLKEQITKETDVNKIDKLSEELETEQEQLRDAEEKITEINLNDYSDAELKTLAIKSTSGNESFFADIFSFGNSESNNKYENELLRRERKRQEINRKEIQINQEEKLKRELLQEKLNRERQRQKAEIKKEQDGGSFFDEFF